MKSYRLFLVFIFANFSTLVLAQDFDLEKYNREKQEILNLVFNTIQFDSVYNSKKLYIVENELLSQDSPIVIKRKKCKAIIMTKEKLVKRNKSYIGLGDFTLERHPPIRARVQVFTSTTNQLLNFGLEKKEGVWIIVNFLIMED
jgi:hypothetical protein